MHETRVCGDRDGTESVLEMREYIGCRLGVSNFDEEGVGLNSIVETVEVEEMNRISFIIGQLSNSKVS